MNAYLPLCFIKIPPFAHTCLMKEILLQQANAMQKELVEIRRYLHSHAETGFALTETTQFVTQQLQKIGLEPTPCGKSGIVATLSGKKANAKDKTLLLRADMDALPIPEQTQLDFACDNGNMHACGHDFHTAMLLGAAKLLKEHEQAFGGQVKLMFQPAEELLEGAKDMLENGVLKKPAVQAGFMFHVVTGVPLPVGCVLIANEGVSAPAADYFKITVQGKGCHGSTPSEGVDALTVAARILLALQEIPARELGISDPAVLTVGVFQGGKAGNVIADSAVLEGTLRSFDQDLQLRIKKRISEIATHIGTAFRATAETTFHGGCPTLVNDGTLSQFAKEAITELLGDDKVFSNPQQAPKAGASEDFAFLSQEIPVVTLALSAGKNDYPLHHPKVEFDESALPIGSATLAHLAVKWLNTP